MTRAIVVAPTAPMSSRGGLGPDEYTNRPSGDGYSERLIKLIPIEVITFYMVLNSTLAVKQAEVPELVWVNLAVGVVATWFHMKVLLKIPSNTQIAISAGAFCVWAINTSSYSAWIDPAYATALLVMYTFFAPGVPIKESSPEPG